MAQRLEETCKKLIQQDGSADTPQEDEASASAEPQTRAIPLRIQEIIQEYLSAKEDECHRSFSEEFGNALLRKELQKAQDLLRQSYQDCKDLTLKYIAVSERVSSFAIFF